MNVLQIALALAVSMLIFATLATMVVEMVHTIVNSRRRGLKKMLGALYDSEVKERLNAALETNGPIDSKQDFINKITLNTGQAKFPADTSVTTMEFVRRLAQTDIGKSIAKRAETEIDVLIDEFAGQYEEYGRQASQLFRRNAEVGSVIVSVFVALLLNINVLVIFKAFQDSEELTRQVALHAEQATLNYQAAEVLKKAAENQQVDVDLKARIETRWKEFDDTVEKAQALGLPIGWPDGEFFAPQAMQLHWVWWLITTILTGFLIGLGGPFWFDVVKKLQPVTQLAGALLRQPTPQVGADKSDEDGTVAAGALVDDPKAAFKMAARTQQIIEEAANGNNGFHGPKAMRV